MSGPGADTQKTDAPTAFGAAAKAEFGQDTVGALRAITDFTSAPDLDALWQVLVDYAGSVDADLLSYHHHAPDFVQDNNQVVVRTHGFSDAWVKTYSEKRLHLTDPITQVFGARIRPMRWSEVDTLVKLTPRQMEYLGQLRSWMTGDGLGLPVFGPGGRHGYVGLGRSQAPIDDWDIIRVNRMHWVMESFHIRWCELVLMGMPANFSLNARELQILQSLAQGESDEIICGIVGAQLDSVRRSIRAILRKMGVTDRPSAVLRGVGAGLIEPHTVV